MIIVDKYDLFLQNLFVWFSQCEKQRKLNDIDMTVILKFHQLQHFVGENEVAKIRDCVVFDKTKLSRLYTRVGELQQETLLQKEKHKSVNHFDIFIVFQTPYKLIWIEIWNFHQTKSNSSTPNENRLQTHGGRDKNLEKQYKAGNDPKIWTWSFPW